MAFEKESKEYTDGLIQGFRLLLNHIAQDIEKQSMFKGKLRDKLQQTVEWVNQRSTIADNGFFVILPNHSEVSWISKNGDNG